MYIYIYICDQIFYLKQTGNMVATRWLFACFVCWLNVRSAVASMILLEVAALHAEEQPATFTGYEIKTSIYIATNAALNSSLIVALTVSKQPSAALNSTDNSNTSC